MQGFKAWLEKNFAKVQSDLLTFLRFRTISADPAAGGEHARCTAWIAEYLSEIGCKTEIIPTSGLPLIYAERAQAGDGAPTLLIYGHYDVQPVDPLELWASDPFEPVIRDGVVFARGALDDKGQIFYAMAAIRALVETNRFPRVNVKFCIEGEEECGSEGLSRAIPSLKDRLRADSLLVVDFGMPAPHTPAISLGARGMITMDLKITGSRTDLHSGEFGGVAYNPNRALAELIAGCWDEVGRVAIPHFYDGVKEVSREEREALARAFNQEAIREAGIEALGGEAGFSPMEANWLRPTLEVNGMSGGYAGPGFKTVIPAAATAKISCRLVPDQDPDRIAQLVADHFRKQVKQGMRAEVRIHSGAGAFRGRADSPLALAVAGACEEVCRKPCLKILAGGSIPVIAQLAEAIRADAVGMGYGLAGDNIHAPNEHFALDRFRQGLLTVALAIENLGRDDGSY